MESVDSDNFTVLRVRKRALVTAIERDRSGRWLLRLWGRFIKTRDAFRCLCCESVEGIQAHHIIRRTRCPWGIFDLGNGVTLCPECHKRVHAEFNGRPDLSSPLGAEQGDDQNEWSFLFGLLRDDAIRRGLPEDEFYHFSDDFLKFSIAYQGYEQLYESVERNELSRLRFMHEIWRPMPEQFYANLASEVGRMLLSEQ